MKLSLSILSRFAGIISISKAGIVISSSFLYVVKFVKLEGTSSYFVKPIVMNPVTVTSIMYSLGELGSNSSSSFKEPKPLSNVELTKS